MVFDGAAVDTAAQAMTADVPAETQEPASSTSNSPDTTDVVAALASAPIAAGSPANVLIFIDAQVTDVAVLAQAVSQDGQIVILDPTRDGLAQIAEIVAAYDDLEAIHIIGHGAEGQITLGTSTLDAMSMEGQYLEALTAVGEALSNSGDILIYGCDFTHGIAGQEAAAILSRITGADVAGSSDATGYAAFGGDWDLEFQLGSVEADVLSAFDWQGLLAPPSLDLDTSDVSPFVVAATDTLETNNYTGGSGWTGGWTETGETTNSGAGDIRNSNDSGDRSIRITDDDGGVDYIQRTANLSGASAATLALDFRNGGLDGGETATVEISSDGTTFVVLDTFDQNDANTYTTFTYDISAYISSTTTVRLSASTNLENNDFAYFDNITISTQAPAPTGYATSYQTNTSPVAITSANVGITDVDSTDIVSATITLTNHQSGDVLSVIGGSLPSGIVASSYNAATGVITLTGSASLASYQTAIEQIGFSSSSSSDDARTINVTVNDGTVDSNTVVSTIAVTLDSDADGVVNNTDIDDDNDGILDQTEIYTDAPVTTTLSYDATASAAATQVNGQPVIILTDGTVTVTITNNSGATITGNEVETDDGSGGAESIRITATSPSGTVLIQGLQFTDLDNFDPSFYVDALALDQTGTWSNLTNTNGTDALVAYSLDTSGETAAGTATGETVSFATLVSAGALSGVLLNPTSATENDYQATFTFDEATSTFLVFGTDTVSPMNQVTTFVFNTLPITYVLQYDADTDADGLVDRIDIDSDNDGITDNVEAQATAGYIAPTGTGVSMADDDNDGLDNAYDANDADTSIAASIGLTPVNTDGVDAADYLDADADNDGAADLSERGDGQATTITSSNDSDIDGLLDIFEGADVIDLFDVNDENFVGAAFTLADSDADTLADGSDAIPLISDLDYRDNQSPPVLVDPDGTPGTPSIDPLDPAHLIVPATDNVAVSIDLDDYVTDPNGDPLSFSVGALPSWLVLQRDHARAVRHAAGRQRRQRRRVRHRHRRQRRLARRDRDVRSGQPRAGRGRRLDRDRVRHAGDRRSSRQRHRCRRRSAHRHRRDGARRARHALTVRHDLDVHAGVRLLRHGDDHLHDRRPGRRHRHRHPHRRRRQRRPGAGRSRSARPARRRSTRSIPRT